MAINIGANFSYNGRNYLDNRQSFDTLEIMKNFTSVPDGFITYCKEDGKRYEFKSSNTINELTGKWTEFKVSAEIPEIEMPEDCYYLGTDEPENDKIWFYTGTAETSSITYDNPLIAELFSVIQAMQVQITQLQADVEYLKLNGGGGIPVEPPDSPEGIEILFALEDGGLMLLEDGGFLILEESALATNDSAFILEDGSSLLLEDGNLMLLE
jgi:hypothetical protein